MGILAKVLAVIAAMALLALVCALPTMWLWNWLMPELFGIKAITFWQALGLSALCSILFKGNASANSNS